MEIGGARGGAEADLEQPLKGEPSKFSIVEMHDDTFGDSFDCNI